MKQLTICLFITVVAFLSSLNGANATEVFRVLLYTDSFPPYSFKTGSSETGIIRDLFKAISKETGDSFEYIRVPFKRGQYQFETGKIDIEPMCNPAWRKNSPVPGLYSIPFATSDEIVLFRSDKYIPLTCPGELTGKTVGTVSGYNYPAFGAYFAEERIKPYPMQDENKLIQMLLAGRLDQALMNKDFANYRIKVQSLQDRLKVSKPCSIVDIMMRLHPTRKHAIPRINKALQKLIDNGTIRGIYDRYR